MELSEILKDKLNERYTYVLSTINLECERSRIIRKFDLEYSKIVKDVYGAPFGNNWKIRSVINDSSKMRKYQRELILNKENRKKIHKQLKLLKQEIKTLNTANSKIS